LFEFGVYCLLYLALINDYNVCFYSVVLLDELSFALFGTTIMD